MSNKFFIWFGASLLCFALAMSYLFLVYVHWDDAVPAEKGSLEVSLPVINWEKYMELSKRMN